MEPKSVGHSDFYWFWMSSSQVDISTYTNIQIQIFFAGGCSCNGHLHLNRGECGEASSSGCGNWSDIPLLLLTIIIICFKPLFAHQWVIILNCYSSIKRKCCPHFPISRCYVDDSNTCRDARPSSYGAPYSWSCQACRSKAKEEKGECLTSVL